MTTVVVGGGIVGLACAYELARRGEEVEVLERDRIGEGCSFGNPGWVAPSHTVPMTEPSLVRTGMREALYGRGALAVHLPLDVSFYRWGLSFLRHTTWRQFDEAAKALIELNRRTFELLDGYRADGIEFEMYESGALAVSRTQERLAGFSEGLNRLRKLGAEIEAVTLSAREAHDLEPAISAGQIGGGVLTLRDRHLHPQQLATGLADRLRSLGAVVREGIEVQGINPGVPCRVETPQGPIIADRVLVAAGYESARFLAPLGVRVRTAGAMGYSTMLRTPGQPRVGRPIYFCDLDTGLSPYREWTRVATGYEIGLRRPAARADRLARTLREVDGYFSDWVPSQAERTDPWSGMRPATADSVPLIGPTPGSDRVFAATGHTTLGVTLAPATAVAIAAQMLDGVTPERWPFMPGRGRAQLRRGGTRG